MISMRNKLASLALGSILVTGMTGCASHTGEGALIGGGVGAGTGAIIGSFSHARAGEGALIGGAIGAIAGGLIGNAQDEQERRARYYEYNPPYTRTYEYPPPPRYYPAPPPPPPPPPPPGYYEERRYYYYR